MVKLVLFRTKAVIILAVVVSILYVLISPLPEMAATKAPHVLFLLVLSFFCIAFSTGDYLRVSQGHEREPEPHLSLDLLCSRLC